MATAGGTLTGVAAWSRTAAWRRSGFAHDEVRWQVLRAHLLAASADRGAVAGPRASRAWDDRSADVAARRRWLDPDPDLGRLHAVVTQGCGDPTADRLLAAAVEAARDHGVRRLDARVDEDDPLAARLIADGWMVGRAGGRLTCSLLLSVPWRQDIASRARGSRLSRSLAAVRWGRVPALTAMVTEEAWGTLRNGTETLPRAVGAADEERGWHPYEAARYRTIRRALALVPASLRRGGFVDLGCGRGRALALASRLPFSRLLGVELDPDLVADARRLNPDPRVEVVQADATTWTLPDDVGVVYLFNPFGPAGLFSLAREVRASRARRPRPLLVVLANPRDLAPLLAVGLEVVHAEPLIALLAIDATSAEVGGSAQGSRGRAGSGPRPDPSRGHG